MIKKTISGWSFILNLFILSLKHGSWKSKIFLLFYSLSFLFSSFTASSSFEVISTEWAVTNSWTMSEEVGDKITEEDKNILCRELCINGIEVPWITYSLIKHSWFPSTTYLQGIWRLWGRVSPFPGQSTAMSLNISSPSPIGYKVWNWPV